MKHVFLLALALIGCSQTNQKTMLFINATRESFICDSVKSYTGGELVGRNCISSVSAELFVSEIVCTVVGCTLTLNLPSQQQQLPNPKLDNQNVPEIGV